MNISTKCCRDLCHGDDIAKCPNYNYCEDNTVCDSKECYRKCFDLKFAFYDHTIHKMTTQEYILSCKNRMKK